MQQFNDHSYSALLCVHFSYASFWFLKFLSLVSYDFFATRNRFSNVRLQFANRSTNHLTSGCSVSLLCLRMLSKRQNEIKYCNRALLAKSSMPQWTSFNESRYLPIKALSKSFLSFRHCVRNKLWANDSLSWLHTFKRCRHADARLHEKKIRFNEICRFAKLEAIDSISISFEIWLKMNGAVKIMWLWIGRDQIIRKWLFCHARALAPLNQQFGKHNQIIFFFAPFAFWLVEFLFWNISIENNKLVLVSFFDAVHRLNFLCMKRKRSKSIVRIGLTTSPSSECIRSRRDVSVKWLTFFRKWKKKHTLGKEQHD